MATGIADGRRHDAGDPPVVLLVAPEAAETEDRGPGALWPRAGERRAQDSVRARDHDRSRAAGEGFSGGGNGRWCGVEEPHVDILRATRDVAMTYPAATLDQERVDRPAAFQVDRPARP